MMSLALRSGLIRVALSLAAGFAAAAAHAGAVTGPVTVLLTSPGGVTPDGGVTVNPTPVLLTDTVPVATGIHANDGPGGFVDTNIGGFMLPGEFVTFGGASADISLRLAAGSQDDRGTADPFDDILETGYRNAGGSRARYVLTGLDIPGEVITGFTVTGSGFEDPLDLTDLISFNASSPGTLSIFLDEIRFLPDARGALFAGGNLVIDLLTRPCTATDPNCDILPPTPMPEPASLLLVLATLAGVPAWRRQRAGKRRYGA